MTAISQIDRKITAIHRELRGLEKIKPMDAGSWQAAWDKHPELCERRTELYRQRGIAQQERDAKAEKDWRASQRKQQYAFKKPSLKNAEIRLRSAMPVLDVQSGQDRLGHYIDCACQAFTDSLWNALGSAYDIQMRMSYFKAENTKRKCVDAIIYRIYVHAEAANVA